MMNKQQILKKIGNIIQELNEQHEYLGNIDEISPLELELFAANADFLSDHIEILKKLNSTGKIEKAKSPVVESVKEIEEVKVLPVVEEMESVKPEIVEEKPEPQEENVEEEVEEKKSFFSFSFDEEPAEMVFDFEKKIAVEDVFDRELSKEEQELIKSKTAPKVKDEPLMEDDLEEEEEELGPEPFIVTPKQEEPQEVVPPKLKDEPKAEEKRLTLNEMLSSKLGNKTTKSGGKAIDDLKSAISLNDKMIFIKELFNGYNLAYSEAIEIINRFESFEAADNFLQKNYAQKNDWDTKTAVVDRLYEYLNRKFIS